MEGLSIKHASCKSNEILLKCHVLFLGMSIANFMYELDHVERKVPKYENHKLRERKVKTLTRN